MSNTSLPSQLRTPEGRCVGSSRCPNWAIFKDGEREFMLNGYWAAYDEEYQELEDLWLQLTRKEAQEEEKRKSEVEKKKKSKPAAPVASGSGSKKGKGKEKEVQVIDSDSDGETDTEFRESCIGCERAKLRCIFTHGTNGKKVTCGRCVERWKPKNEGFKTKITPKE
ncbi:hypothetical protein M422DRAFT_253005 [Sphaerobolus stellatus SS14]|uniref:Uncharacterized protein n=1 Tax=Sphaerobolus stellatus (strain SS14) TaxID=990650 RepID=A0A0C9VNX1_SPHS4|nr:hypothetical protein M422DRAFT_253005 [Sphaerobolus stellatus SS14]